MNSTTITKKNEEENYPAHYLSEAFFSNKSICIRNNHLQKAAVVGWGGGGVARGMHSTMLGKEERFAIHFSRMQTLLCAIQ